MTAIWLAVELLGFAARPRERKRKQITSRTVPPIGGPYLVHLSVDPLVSQTVTDSQSFVGALVCTRLLFEGQNQKARGLLEMESRGALVRGSHRAPHVIWVPLL